MKCKKCNKKINKLNNNKFNRKKMNIIYQNLIILNNKNNKIDFFHLKLKMVNFLMIRVESRIKRKIWQIYYHLINFKIITIFRIFRRKNLLLRKKLDLRIFFLQLIIKQINKIYLILSKIISIFFKKDKINPIKRRVVKYQNKYFDNLLQVLSL